MMEILLNRNGTKTSGKIEEPDQNLVKNSLGLFRASVEDAVRYGGDIAREALSVMDFRNDRKYITVDVKVHMLMPGFSPAIPGWHTDGVPRSDPKKGFNVDYGVPRIDYQDSGQMEGHRYHLLVTGRCLTKFIDDPLIVDLPDEPTNELYKLITRQVNKRLREKRASASFIQPNTVTEFDWWSLHTATQATHREWRYFIRAVESDYYEPLSDLRDIIRMQQQAYAPQEFGW